MLKDLTLTPRDPLIARDGRPFGATQGRRMRSLDWPYPSVLAGSLRTLLGKSAGGHFKKLIEDLCQISISGPLPLVDKTLYLPAPKDLVIYEDENNNRRIMPLRPLEPKCGGGTDLSEKNLSPVNVTKDVKPANKIPAFWSKDKICDWLINASGDDFDTPPEQTDIANGFLYAPEKEQRTHVKIEPGYGVSEEGMLFITSGLDFTFKHGEDNNNLADIKLAARAKLPDNSPFVGIMNNLDALHPFGGERRLLHWKTETQNGLWDCPSEIDKTLDNKPQKVRLVLATPALFRGGWRPGWLNDDLEGAPPGAEGKIKLKLKSVCVERWKPLSGWSLKPLEETGKPGPKPIRRLVPAGSVYFFEAAGDAGILKDLWLKPVSDYEEDNQDKRDGFGLALWGIW
jgi:CRISPR-associated protein Cmr3